MTLNGVMAVTLRYFIEFGKSAFQHVSASICGGIYARPWMTLNGAIASNRHVMLPNSEAFGANYVKVVEDTPILSAAEM